MNQLSDEDIREIEESVRLSLPPDVRDQYRVSNGLTGPANCQLLYTFKFDENTDIVRANELRKEPWFPAAFHSLVLVGNDGCGSLIGYDWVTNEAILWNPADGEWVQERRNTVTEMWVQIGFLYGEAEA